MFPVRKLCENILDEFIKQPITMIFGAMRDKDLTEISEILFPKAENLILTKPDNPRSMEVSELLKILSAKILTKKFNLTENVADAIEKAKNIFCRKTI